MMSTNKEHCSIILKNIKKKKKVGKQRRELILHTSFMLERSGCQKHRIIFCGLFSHHLAHNEVSSQLSSSETVIGICSVNANPSCLPTP